MTATKTHILLSAVVVVFLVMTLFVFSLGQEINTYNQIIEDEGCQAYVEYLIGRPVSVDPVNFNFSNPVGADYVDPTDPAVPLAPYRQGEYP